MTDTTSSTVVFITALSLEFKAVKEHLENITEQIHPKGTIYEVGEYVTTHARWQVVVVEVGQRNPAAALETERAISQFNPEYAFFVGIAGGIKDVALGDVVVAEVVKGYEGGKATDEDFLPRSEVYRTDYRLVQRAKAVSRNADWLSKIKSKHGRAHAWVATIVAGEKVVASIRSSVYKFITKEYSDAIAVEMEGIGFLSAVAANYTVGGIVIRGVSDLLKDKSATSDKHWQSIAASNAAAFAFAMLDQLVPVTTLVTSIPSTSPITSNDDTTIPSTPTMTSNDYTTTPSTPTMTSNDYFYIGVFFCYGMSIFATIMAGGIKDIFLFSIPNFISALPLAVVQKWFKRLALDEDEVRVTYGFPFEFPTYCFLIFTGILVFVGIGLAIRMLEGQNSPIHFWFGVISAGLSIIPLLSVFGGNFFPILEYDEILDDTSGYSVRSRFLVALVPIYICMSVLVGIVIFMLKGQNSVFWLGVSSIFNVFGTSLVILIHITASITDITDQYFGQFD